MLGTMYEHMHGYALRGITPVYQRRILAISAISDNGLAGVELTYGTVKGIC